MPHNSTVIKCIDISKIISSEIYVLGKKLGVYDFVRFPETDKDSDPTRKGEKKKNETKQ